jgi:hypothetical protein
MSAITDVNNMTENLTSNPFRVWLIPYTDVVGLSFFVSYFFGIIGAGVYIGSKNFQATIGYFLITFIFMAAVLPSITLVVFGLIAALMTTSLLYYALVTKRR